MKKGVIKIIKGLGISIIAIVLITVGIDASDHYDNYSESIVGRLLLGKPKSLCGDDMVYVPNENGGFCIDKYEASAGPDCQNKNPNNQNETRINVNNKNCRPVSVPSSIPWRNISQTQAEISCSMAGKRLPTDEEWYQAAMGTPDINGGWTADDCQIASNWDFQPGLTGSGKNCVSSAGAYDMIGNAWEWVKGEIRDGYYDGHAMPEQGYIKAVDIHGIPIETDKQAPDPNHNNDFLWIKAQGVRGMARGGYWDNYAEGGQFSVYLVSEPSFAGIGVGFRCVK
jgi:formylglycine-generating enzyme required for sulfatase activity